MNAAAGRRMQAVASEHPPHFFALGGRIHTCRSGVHSAALPPGMVVVVLAGKVAVMPQAAVHLGTLSCGWFLLISNVQPEDPMGISYRLEETL